MLSIHLSTTGVMDMARALEVMGKRLPSAQALVLNRVGTRTKAVVVATLPEQTGLPRRIIVKAVKMNRASPNKLRVDIWTRGGDISLKYFHPREEGGSVVARVYGDKVVIAGGFRRSGRDPNRRMVKKLNGHVYVNTDGGRWRGHIRKVKSGVLIPAEMIRGKTRAAFDEVVHRELPAEIAKELAKILP
ncbi:hypothetical protein [Methylobacterium nodulans]|uniref:Prophage minor tail Z family protein n=1 Tax=Methylobacterium nodulans (strain LMG 21967 / CNCM I-2342 / ORS 2060) TaxID=460265 RepID=B8ICK9_METNO|nr:hypothetical protein [Methylobacterium nodulans]ACL57420.1 conserved hypothetical protein [Methylobacterium nodulans ORS 2060]